MSYIYRHLTFLSFDFLRAGFCRLILILFSQIIFFTLIALYHHARFVKNIIKGKGLILYIAVEQYTFRWTAQTLIKQQLSACPNLAKQKQ